MDTIECIKTRRSVRKYQDKEIDIELINEVMDAVRYSPSWKNTEAIRYTVVMNNTIKNEIANKGVCGFSFNAKTIERSKALVIQTAIKYLSGYEADKSFSTPKGEGFEMYDAGISAQTLALACHNYGLGSVIMGIYDESEIRKIVDINENETITALIALGYPLEIKEAPKRIEKEEIVRFIK